MMKWLIVLLWFLVADGYAATVCIKTASPTPTPVPTATPTPGGNTITLGGTPYSIASHPRFTTSARLTALRNKAVAGKQLWDQLAANNDGLAGACSPADATWYHTLYGMAVGYLAKPTKTEWRDCALTLINQIPSHTASSYNSDYGSMNLAIIAYVYDILHADMTSAQRASLINWVWTQLVPYLQTHLSGQSDPLDTLGASVCDDEPMYNLCMTKFWGQYLFSLACVDDDYRCSASVEDLYDWYHVTEWYEGHTHKGDIDAAYVGCNSFAGSNYGRVRVQPYILEVADAENTALGMDSWETWMDSCPQFYVQSTLPDYEGNPSWCQYLNSSGTANLCHTFDSYMQPGLITYDGGRNLRGILLPMERDRTTDDAKMAQDWLKNIHGVKTTPYSDKGRINTSYYGKEYLAEWFLRYDPDAATLDYTDWPTTYVATGQGHVFSRDAWGNQNRFWMSNAAPSYNWDHQVIGCGGFKTFKTIGVAGEYGIVYNQAYFGAEAEQTDLSGASGSILFLGNGTVTYLGTPYVTGGFDVRGASTQVCTVDNASIGTNYAYWQDNLDAAYDTSAFPVSYVRRNFFHLKPITKGEASNTKNYVVLMDSASTTNSITTTQYFYVPNNSPTVSDPNVTSTLTNTKTIIRRIYPTDGTIASASVTDRSYVSSYSVVPGVGCPQCYSGMSRVTNPTASGTSHFSGVVIMQDSTAATLPTTTAISGATNALKGVVIDDSVSWVILGPATATAVAGVTFTFSADPANSAQYVVCGLTAGTKYNYTVDGTTHTMTQNAGGAITVNTSGCAEWQD